MERKAIARTLLALAAALATGGACSRNQDTVGMIGPAGGTLSADDGRVRLDFPPGAVPAPTEIHIAPAPSGATGIVAGSAYAFSPEGLTFAAPVGITLRPTFEGPFTTSAIAVAKIEGQEVQLDEGPTVDAAAHTVGAKLAGFSTHGAAAQGVLCPNGCPTVPTLTATVQPTAIELGGNCTASGAGQAAEIVIERAFVPALTSVASAFQNWSVLAVIPAGPWSNGQCLYQYVDTDVCLGWTYAYRARGRAIRVTSAASPTVLAIGPGTRQCSPPAGAGTTVTIHTYERADAARANPTNAAWVGGQDGSGAWAVLQGQAGVYQLAVADPGGRYGVAVACAARPLSTQATVVQATLAEGRDIHVVCPTPLPGSAAVAITAHGCTGAAQVAIGGATDPSVACTGQATAQAQVGAHDVIAASTRGADPDRVLVSRGFSGAALTVDFAGASSAPAARHVVRTRARGSWFYSFDTEAGSFLYTPPLGATSYPGFPAALRAAPDRHIVFTVDPANPHHTGYLHHYAAEPVDIDDSNATYAPIPGATATRLLVDFGTYPGVGFWVAIGDYALWVSSGWLKGQTVYNFPHLCLLGGFPLPCLDTLRQGTQFAVRGFTAAGGAAVSLVDVHNGEALSSTAPDGLVYSEARYVGSTM